MIPPQSLQSCQHNTFQFYLQLRRQKKVEWVGDDSHVVFPGEKGSVRWCCCDATASSFVAKVRGKVFTHFQAVTIRHHSSMWN
jgi:hypothetical protein